MAFRLVDEFKLRPPRPIPDTVDRPALRARLEALAERDFLIVAAPAGFGKSSAVGSWAAGLSVPPAWLSLGTEDDNFLALYPLVIRALALADPARREAYERLEDLAREASAAQDVPRLAAAALARVMRGRAGSVEPAPVTGLPIRLVIDDFHRCPDRAASVFLLALSDFAAPELKIVLLGRRDPELPLARLRAEARLGEIRARDLRFGREETLRFLPALGAAEGADSELAAVEARLEGWPAGLRLLKLSLEDKTDPAASLARLGSSRRFVLDYLVEEVLAGLEPGLADFLFRTAIAEPFTAELAARLLGGPECLERAEAYLGRVAAENLFLVSLDEEGGWQRYHHLFGDLLRMRASRALGEALPRLRKEAAAWFDERGLRVYACGQLLEGGFTDEAFEYLVRSSREMYISGRIPEILGLYDRLPFEGFREEPDAAVWYSWFLTTVGRGERVPTLLAWAEAAAPAMSEPGGEPRVRAGVAMIRGLLSLRAGELREAVRYEEESQRLNEGALPRDRAVSGYIRGLALAGLGESGPASEAFEESERLAALGGDDYTQGMALCERARLVAAGGDGQEALGLLARAAALGSKPGQKPALWVGLAYVHEARILAALGRDREALARVREGLGLCLDRGYPPPIVLARRLLFDLALKAGDLSWAERGLEELADFARAAGMRSALDSAAEAAGLLREARAREAARSLGADGRDLGAEADEARPGMAAGTTRSAGAAAATHAAPANAAVVNATVVQAAAADAASTGASAAPGSRRTPMSDPPPLQEALSPRELEVLELIEDGMTNQEIADALFVSLSTVKTHVHHISTKLGSTNRTETVALARELGLLST